MLVRRHHDAEPRAVRDIDMRIDAALTDQPQFWQLVEQCLPDLRPLPDENQHLGFAQSVGQLPDILNVIIPDRDVVTVQFCVAGQRT